MRPSYIARTVRVLRTRRCNIICMRNVIHWMSRSPRATCLISTQRQPDRNRIEQVFDLR